MAMHITVELESLRCTTGGSDKSYTVAAVSVNNAPTALIKIYGPTSGPKECLFGDYNEDDWYRTLASKLKKYKRVRPKQTYTWVDKRSRWLDEGGDYLSDIIEEHGQWVTMGTGAFRHKLGSAANFVVAGIADDVDVEELFQTPPQREQRKQEKQEALNLENWGCF